MNIDWGNGLVSSGNKLLPHPMLTQIYLTISATMTYYCIKSTHLPIKNVQAKNGEANIWSMSIFLTTVVVVAAGKMRSRNVYQTWLQGPSTMPNVTIRPDNEEKEQTSINILAPGWCGCNLELVVYKLMLRIDVLSISRSLSNCIRLEGPEDPHLRNSSFRKPPDLAHASILLAQTPWGLTGRAWL